MVNLPDALAQMLRYARSEYCTRIQADGEQRYGIRALPRVVASWPSDLLVSEMIAEIRGDRLPAGNHFPLTSSSQWLHPLAVLFKFQLSAPASGLPALTPNYCLATTPHLSLSAQSSFAIPLTDSRNLGAQTSVYVFLGFWKLAKVQLNAWAPHHAQQAR